MPVPAALPENAGLAFLGEPAWAPAQLTDREAQKLLAAANACGRPNIDVLRGRLAVVDGEPVESCQVDFPGHFTAQEAALYEQPFALLQKRAGAWRNPHTQPALRRALARVSRWLALPVGADAPDWRWIEEEVLPDASLLVVAREDDFTHGILSSPVFASWWARHRAQPLIAIESFPFPWPPTTPLSALSKIQEEHRHAIVRATRGGDAGALNGAVLAAYGWPANLSEEEMFERLAMRARESVRPRLT
ncbi:hypothetical protein ESB00_04940 [Oleiharenicola lentus]|uniref:Uncharacterized protein n=1 Tax=Oleiharenicola lentus TaxID=2508720 RepID=A0A4Q1C8R0_9BACT|nr:hypothetical protein [Oleiharenicola lentus]RXK55246.1 hypothetical protein ESB00_04940 [Oleiharenicola lentus]